MVRRFLYLLMFVTLSIGCQHTRSSGVASEESVFFLVRHAEKVDDSDDSSLTEQGRHRAESLASLLRDSGIQSIYSSDFARTRQTGDPLARELGLDVEIYDANDLAPFAQRLLGNSGRHLVVGHSNTTPDLVQLLGGTPGPKIESMEYDRLYVLAYRPGVGMTTVVLRFEP